MNTEVVATISKSPIEMMADRLSIDPAEMHNIIMATVMPNGGKGVTNEQFVSFVAVANNYNLDPLKKEIYAFPAKGGGIQPIVSIDGWLNIVNGHPDFDGMQLVETFDEKGVIFSVTCTIHKKSTRHPTVIAEYLSECIRNTEPWKKKIRMLRHKATIQCARYAFGLSGIMEQDEAEAATEKDITPGAKPQSAMRGPDTKEGVADIIKNTILETGEYITPVETLLEKISLCETHEELALVKQDCAPHMGNDAAKLDLVGAYNTRLAEITPVAD